MRGLARLTGHESCMRIDENYKRLNKMADISERLSDTQEKPETSDVMQVNKKKENIITCHRQVTVGVMTRTVSSLTSVKKRRKRTMEATSKNKKIEKRRKTLVIQLSYNSHCSFDRVMRVEETLMRSLACQLSSTLILV